MSEQARKRKPRVFSKHFPVNIRVHSGGCFVPLEDYRELERKYIKLFKRYQSNLPSPPG